MSLLLNTLFMLLTTMLHIEGNKRVVCYKGQMYADSAVLIIAEQSAEDLQATFLSIYPNGHFLVKEENLDKAMAVILAADTDIDV